MAVAMPGTGQGDGLPSPHSMPYSIIFSPGIMAGHCYRIPTESSIPLSLRTSDSHRYPSINRGRMASLCLYNQHPIYTKMYQITVGSKCAQLSQMKRTGVFLVT